MTQEQYEAMHEGSYWFCLNDLSYFVKQFGLSKVLADLKDLQDNHDRIEKEAANKKQLLDDLPF